MNCDYCQGDRDGYVSFLPKIKKCNGNAAVKDGGREILVAAVDTQNKKISIIL